MCCNELNTLVPFCKQDTDKASTLQWTVAYLKYIKEVYGESPSKVDCISIRVANFQEFSKLETFHGN